LIELDGLETILGDVRTRRAKLMPEHGKTGLQAWNKRSSIFEELFDQAL
jgi:hypothetical protein